MAETIVVTFPDTTVHLAPRYLTSPPYMRCGVEAPRDAVVQIHDAVPDDACAACCNMDASPPSGRGRRVG